MELPVGDQVEKSKLNPIVFFDIAIESEKVGRVVMELFEDVVPRTAENFRVLCTGEKGIGINGKKLHYKGSYFHKVIPHCMAQGGDIINFNGTGGESIYGPHFEDENFKLSHSTEGLLSMVNEDRPNSNSSQFVITTAPCLHLDNTNVVFGKVIKGMGVIYELSEVETVKDVPVQKIQITECGELKREENWGLEENDDSKDTFTPWPEDWDYYKDTKDLNYEYMIEVVRKIKESGNQYFLKKNYVDAGRKYKKALRYHKWMVKKIDMPTTSDKSIADLNIAVLLNLAAVKLKRNEYRDALSTCNEVLQFDKNNSKALFRRSQAYVGMNEYDLGLADLKQALSLSPDNRDILEEIKKVKKMMNSYLVVEKAACQRMFK